MSVSRARDIICQPMNSPSPNTFVHEGQKKRHFAGRFITLAVALAIFTGVASCPSASAQSQSLDSLENHFFEHTYKTDSTDNRLTRLEKLVFGEARTGSDQDRLAQLSSAVPPAPAAPPPSTQTGAGSSGNNLASNGGSSSQSSGDDQADTQSGTDYPRVTELEKVMLGKTYTNEPIKHRLDQLELKAFGKTKSDEDLADRTDRIAQYADKKYGGRDVASAGLPAQPRSGSLEDKVSWLETQIEGQAFPQKPMIERLRPLEKAMFPTDPTDIHASIPEQVNMLMSAVELLHKQQTGAASGDQELSIAPLTQAQQNQQMGYARQNQANSQIASGYAPPTGNYSSGYQSPQAYARSQGSSLRDEYAQSPGTGYAQPQYNQSPSYSQTQSYSQAQPAQTAQANHNHPLWRGLAKALGTVGTMVGSSMMSGGMMNFGGGGYPGGYGYNSYGNGMNMNMGGGGFRF
jgi:hypothetical protein